VLFDLAPKRSKKDFYNFEHELEQLYKLYLSGRIVAVWVLGELVRQALS